MNAKVVEYKQVPVSAIFQVLKDEQVGDKVVRNVGKTYQRVEISHSVDIHTKKVAIFAQNAPCRVIKASAPLVEGEK